MHRTLSNLRRTAVEDPTNLDTVDPLRRNSVSGRVRDWHLGGFRTRKAWYMVGPSTGATPDPTRAHHRHVDVRHAVLDAVPSCRCRC